MNGSVKVEKVEFKGWQNCFRVSNDSVELVVTGDVGPRIMHYGFIGEKKFFKEFNDQLGKSGERDFRVRGGHRLWRAPEDLAATWVPDNVHAEINTQSCGLIARAPVEPASGLQKEIEVKMAQSGSEVGVIHRITNHSGQLLTLRRGR